MIIVEPEIVDHVEFSCSQEEFDTLHAILSQSRTMFDHVDFYLDDVTKDDLSHLISVFDLAEESPFIMHKRDFWMLSAVVNRTETLIIENVSAKVRDAVVTQMLDVGVSGRRSGLASIGNSAYVSKGKQV